MGSIASKHGALTVLPAKNNGSLACRIPTLTFPKIAVIISPLVTLVASRIGGLHDQNIGTRILRTNLSHGEVFSVLRRTRFNTCGLLCISPRHLASRLFLGQLRFIRIDVVTISRTRYVSR